ncbi:MAG TPA: prephenate dehydrogenase/arogenate dehydrogenase family protein [Actinomycetota bacterium]|jgi:prephenate dehydrogenase|nr:prephenate dehydrogenase/arogenate dehydrogenase family protein [Actinomycetota bacterium]
MTSTDRVAVIGTGLIGTSIALAAARLGQQVRGFDADRRVLAVAAERSGLHPTSDAAECARGATLVFLCTPVETIPAVASEVLGAEPEATVTDVASVKSRIMVEVEAAVRPADLPRFVGGHPMGGSERSGPRWAAAGVLDGIVWVLTPTERSSSEAQERLSAWIARVGGKPMIMDPARHDRLVAAVSHLPQVASTALMGLAAAEEAGEPDILLLAAGGFRDLTRLAASNPQLWSQILLANREAVAEAIHLYVKRLSAMRDLVLLGSQREIEATFDEAKAARLALGAKATVRTGVAVLQVPVPDRPGALADLTSALGAAQVNIEDLQIVHSPEGGRGTVHLTVGRTQVEAAVGALGGHGFEPRRLA